jgi:hypothetical protein
LVLKVQWAKPTLTKKRGLEPNAFEPVLVTTKSPLNWSYANRSSHKIQVANRTHMTFGPTVGNLTAGNLTKGQVASGQVASGQVPSNHVGSVCAID